MERTINMKLEERLEGAIGERGKFTGYTLNKKGLENGKVRHQYYLTPKDKKKKNGKDN